MPAAGAIATDVPLLFTFDVTNTIAEIDGPSHVDLICEASPRSRAEVCDILNNLLGLKTLPSRSALTPTLVETACTLLDISREQFPFGELPLAPYRLRDEAPAAVAAAAACLPAALITNTSVFADPGLQPLANGLHPHIAAIHASWAMGAAKPDPHAFWAAANYHQVAPRNLIHIGDSWSEDIAPVLALGGRAVWLNKDNAGAPGPGPVPRGRLLVATTLTEAVEQAIARWLIGTFSWEHPGVEGRRPIGENEAPR
jgi:FMN phosphatase YigB (HAD superfamily)